LVKRKKFKKNKLYFSFFYFVSQQKHINIQYIQPKYKIKSFCVIVSKAYMAFTMSNQQALMAFIVYAH